MSMSSASSARFALRRWAPPFPLISYPDCGRVVIKRTSGTTEHKGWVFYRCEKHGRGCNFLALEMEYIGYLVDNDLLCGDAAVDAIGWAEERREDLQLRKEEKRLTVVVKGPEEKMIDAIGEVVPMLKIVALLLCVMLVVVMLKK